ncbi:MAG: hypothetical protein DBX52_07520 [Clostridiales bacterium]|nr:MAG: hypothetical protein DBX52_07520 [Clostridiales bacterium]
MVSEREFFAGLYGDALQPILIFNAAERLVFSTAAAADLLNRLGEADGASLISPTVHMEMERCLMKKCGATVPVNRNDHLLTLFLVPYMFAGKDYLVMHVGEKPVSLEGEDLRRMFRNSQGKLASYLNEIYGIAQTIGLDTPEGKEIGVAVRRILRMSNHLYQSLDGQGKIEYRIPMEIGGFVAGFIRNLNEVDHRIRIFAVINEAELYVRMMPEDMELVLGTLLSNAIRFGGEEISVRIRREGEKVWLTVFDNGPGVQNPERLFEWGYRTRDKQGRNGLGFSLPMAKKLLEQQGAELLYEHADEGTSFHIVMDREEMPAGRMAEWTAEPLENSLSQIRIEMSDLVKE